MKNTCIQSKCIGMHLIFLQPRFLIEFPTPPPPPPLLSHYTHIRLNIRSRRSMYTIQLINSLVLHIILDLMDLISSALTCLVLLHFKEDEDRVIFRVYSSAIARHSLYVHAFTLLIKRRIQSSLIGVLATDIYYTLQSTVTEEEDHREANLEIINIRKQNQQTLLASWNEIIYPVTLYSSSSTPP